MSINAVSIRYGRTRFHSTIRPAMASQIQRGRILSRFCHRFYSQDFETLGGLPERLGLVTEVG